MHECGVQGRWNVTKCTSAALRFGIVLTSAHCHKMYSMTYADRMNNQVTGFVWKWKLCGRQRVTRHGENSQSARTIEGTGTVGMLKQYRERGSSLPVQSNAHRGTFLPRRSGRTRTVQGNIPKEAKLRSNEHNHERWFNHNYHIPMNKGWGPPVDFSPPLHVKIAKRT